jgi:DNA-binding NarL/FixJ family response regulator
MKKLKTVLGFILMLYSTFVKRIYRKFNKHSTTIQLTRTFEGTKKSTLTAREIEVCQLIAEGNSTKDIAKKLNLSENTIHNYRTRIYSKTDCRNVVDLINYAIKNDIVAIKK